MSNHEDILEAMNMAIDEAEVALRDGNVIDDVFMEEAYQKAINLIKTNKGTK